MGLPRAADHPSASDLAGKAVLLEIGAELGVIDLLQAGEAVDLDEAALASGVPREALERYLDVLAHVGLVEALTGGRFRSLAALDDARHATGYLSWALRACAPLVAHARDFANAPEVSIATHVRDGGLVARTSRWMGERSFYPDAERAVLARSPTRLIDLGAGAAKLLIRCLRQLPTARALAIDLSATACAQAREAATRAGVAGRLEIVHAPIQSLVCERRALLEGADAIHAGFVFHDLLPDEEKTLDDLLRACFEASPRVSLVISDATPYARAANERSFSAAFSYLHERFMGRRLLDETEWAEKLRHAGFGRVEVKRLGIPGGRLWVATRA